MNLKALVNMRSLDVTTKGISLYDASFGVLLRTLVKTLLYLVNKNHIIGKNFCSDPRRRGLNMGNLHQPAGR